MSAQTSRAAASSFSHVRGSGWSVGKGESVEAVAASVAAKARGAIKATRIVAKRILDEESGSLF